MILVLYLTYLSENKCDLIKYTSVKKSKVAGCEKQKAKQLFAASSSLNFCKEHPFRNYPMRGGGGQKVLFFAKLLPNACGRNFLRKNKVLGKKVWHYKFCIFLLSSIGTSKAVHRDGIFYHFRKNSTAQKTQGFFRPKLNETVVQAYFFTDFR